MRAYIVAGLMASLVAAAAAEPGPGQRRAALREELEHWKAVLREQPDAELSERYLPPLEALSRWAAAPGAAAQTAEIWRAFEAWKRDLLAAGGARIASGALSASPPALAVAAGRQLAEQGAPALDSFFDNSAPASAAADAVRVVAPMPVVRAAERAPLPRARPRTPPPPSGVGAAPPGEPLARLRRALVELGIVSGHIFDVIVGQAAALRIDPTLALALTHAESSFNARAVSRAGARGLMQLMPATARWLGIKSEAELFEPVKNVRAGLLYLRDQLRSFATGAAVRLVGLAGPVNAGEALAIAAYNAGPGRVRKYRGIPPYAETVKHVRRVMGLREFYLMLAGRDRSSLLV